MSTQPKKVAVVGGGVAGIVAAYLLQERHDVSLFEANDYLGGHTHTIEIPDGADAGLPVDTGFIVLNDHTYPLFQRFLARLGVATRDSEMSFGLQCHQSGFAYAGTNFSGLFTRRANLFRPGFYRFLLEIGRFSRNALRDLDAPPLPRISLGEYLERGRYSQEMVHNYLVPMAAAIWSTPARQITDFPAEPFLHFFRNHGLLSLRNRPRWKTVTGGSHTYVKAFVKQFPGKLHLATKVRGVTRNEGGTELELPGGARHRFDAVVMACHADQSLRLLTDADHEETRLLGPWTYQKNHTVLHRGDELLPPRPAARAAWNFTRLPEDTGETPVFVSYYMNLLQALKAQSHYCVTLNRPTPYRNGSVIAEMDYEHPLYTRASMDTQAELPHLNGRRNTWFCGSYFGYGFHEDAVRSAQAVGSDFGATL